MKTLLISLLLAGCAHAQNAYVLQELHARGGGAEGQIKSEHAFTGTDFSVLGGWDSPQVHFTGILEGPELEDIDINQWLITSPSPVRLFTLSSAAIKIDEPFFGSIFAPNAHVKMNADVHGNIFAKNLSITDAWIRPDPYCAVPEPKAAMMILAAAMIGIFTLRRK